MMASSRSIVLFIVCYFIDFDDTKIRKKEQISKYILSIFRARVLKDPKGQKQKISGTCKTTQKGNNSYRFAR